MTDHKEAAENWMQAADDSPRDIDAQPQMYMAVAQVHATLYLAEQQRVANQIAWANQNGYSGYSDVITEIRERLGIPETGFAATS